MHRANFHIVLQAKIELAQRYIVHGRDNGNKFEVHLCRLGSQCCPRLHVARDNGGEIAVPIKALSKPDPK